MHILSSQRIIRLNFIRSVEVCVFAVFAMGGVHRTSCQTSMLIYYYKWSSEIWRIKQNVKITMEGWKWI